MREPAVYIMTNKRNGTLYTGVTSDIGQRAYEHREGLTPGFTTRYGCKMLVWYEFYDLMTDAIDREKQIKAGSRNAKLRLIEALNPTWQDLFETLA
jgi:predicted GIY-YIG superfamily endonuclease